LVKSAQMMVVTAQDLKRADINCPILVGGAALSNRFTRLKIGPEYDGIVAYASDAMTGLDLANQLADEARRATLHGKLVAETATIRDSVAAKTESVAPAPVRPAHVRRDHDIPTPPDLKVHAIRDHDLDEIFRYINPVMLYTRHLGFKGKFEDAL